VKLLIELDARFRNAKFPNIKIQRFLPSKTADQIRNKRKDLPRLVRQHSISSIDDEEACAPSEAPTTSNEVILDEAVEEVADESAAEPWLEEIKKAIQAEALVSNDLNAIYNHLMAIWFAAHNDLNKLNEDIESFIAVDLTPFLLKENKGNNNENRNDSKNNSKNNSKNRRNDRVTRGRNKERHNTRRRYEYARS